MFCCLINHSSVCNYSSWRLDILLVNRVPGGKRKQRRGTKGKEQKEQLVVSLLSLFSIVEKLSSNWYSGWCFHAIAILTTAMIQKSFSRHIAKLTTNQARQNMNKLNSRTFLFNSMMKGSLVTLVTCSDVTSSVSLYSFLFNSMMKEV